MSWMKYGPLLSLFVVLLAFWFRSPHNAVLDDRLNTVLSSLLRAERKVGLNGVARPKVAVGKCKWCELVSSSLRCLADKLLNVKIFVNKTEIYKLIANRIYF